MKTFTKQIIMMCLMISITHIGLAQCHSWLDLSSPNPIKWGAWSVATDQNNNVYSTGVFTGSISFGSNTLTNPTGETSFYINKINSGGVVQWAIQLPVTTYMFPPVICQKNGILYVAGAFAGSVGIGSNTITTSRGHYALFVLKLDLNGNIIGYTPEFGGLCNTLAYTLGITVNSLNEIYLTGRADGVFSFSSTLLSNSEGSYAYLAKFSSDLNTIWAIQSNSTATYPKSRGWGITLDNNENVIIGGWFTQDIEFGTTSFNANNNTGGVNPYIAKFDNAGNCQWIRGGQGPQYYYAGPVYTVVSDKSGNIYYAGSIDTTMVIDGNTLNPANGTFFYCKYTPTGNLVWVHQAGNNSKESTQVPTSLVIDDSDNMWNSGWINGPASFGGYPLSNRGTYITKLDLDGNFHGVIGSIGLESSYQSVLDADGNLFVAGLAAGDTISFDGNTIININDTSGVDFVLKYCTSTPLNQELANVDIPNGVTTCYDAQQILTVAGNGTTFLVENGGNVTLVAGISILLLEGTTISSGGYLHGYITTNDTYCGTLLNPLVANNQNEQALGVETVAKNQFIKVYPNPTTDIVIVELIDAVSTDVANITVYTMNGGKLYQKDFKGESKFQFSLAGKPVGIYLVHVQSGKRSEIAKVVKN